MFPKSSQATENRTAYAFGEFVYDAENNVLFRGAETILLPPKACEILGMLIENAGRVVSRDDLLGRIWAETFVEEANLTHHISNLRKALGEDKNGKKFIETIPRRGYRFVAEVRESSNAAAEMAINERMDLWTADEPKTETSDAPLEKNTEAEAILPDVKRRRWQTVLAGALAVAVLAGISFAVYKYLNPVPRRFSAKSTVRLTSSGRVNNAVISPDGKFVAYTQEELDRRQSLRLQHIGSDSSTIVAAPAAIEFCGLAIAPDGNALYYLDAEGSLFQIPTFGGTAKKLAAGLHVFTGGANTVGVSPDGKQIAFVRRFEAEASAIFILQTDGSGERQLAAFVEPDRLGQSVAWSPDGQTIACWVITAGWQNIFVFRLADGSFKRMFPQDEAALGDMAWLPDSKNLLMSGRTLDFISSPNISRSPIFNEDTTDYQGVSLTADGRFLSVVKNSTTANVWTMPNGDAGGLRKLTTGTQTFDGIKILTFMPDGTIVHNAGTKASIITATKPDGSAAREMFKDIYGGALSPDGRYFVYRKDFADSSRDGLFRIDLRDGSEQRLTTGSESWETFAPDGKTVFYTRFGEHIGLWKVSIEGGEAQQILAANAICPAVSPDGKTLAFILRRAGQPNRIALVPATGGETSKVFEVEIAAPPAIYNLQKLQWTADGHGVYFLAAADGGTNIWRQPVDGSMPAPLTNFKDGRIFNFVFSPDEKQIALSRGAVDSNIVFIENSE